MPQTHISKLFHSTKISKRGLLTLLLWLICILLLTLFGYFIYRYKTKKAIIFENYANRSMSTDLWIQSSPNLEISVYYANGLIKPSSLQNGKVSQYTISNTISGQKVYIHCKKSQSIVSTEGTYIICKYRMGSIMYYSNKSTFKFEGIKVKNGIIIKDKYLGCFPSQNDDNMKALPVTASNDKLTRDQCRNLAVSQNYQFYALNDGGSCALANTGYDRFGGDTDIANCQMPCEKNISERCGGEKYNSVYSVKELIPDTEELEPLGGGLIDSNLELAKRIWISGGDEVEGTWVASFEIPDLSRQSFCPDPDFVEFNPAGCINSNDVSNCKNTVLANYVSKDNLCLTRFDWTDIDNFTITVRKVFDYLTRLSAKKIFVRFNADKSIYSYSSLSADPGSDDPTIDGNSSWTPLFGDVSQKTSWVKINAGKTIDIGGIILKGGGDNRNFVSKLIVSYSRDEINWTILEEIDGNTDASSIKYIFFEAAAQYVKIQPTSFNGSNVSLCFDLLVPNKTSNMGIDGKTSSSDISTNVPISMKSLTNINTLDGVVKAANSATKLGPSPEYTTSHKYVSKFVFANYKLVVLLKIIAEKTEYPVDIQQITADGIVIPNTPMYYNLIRKGVTYTRNDAIKLQFDRFYKDVFLYARLITETPMMVRTCDCIEGSVDNNQKCAPC
jgi:hypothetical protein